jgi:hypothetical protein
MDLVIKYLFVGSLFSSIYLFIFDTEGFKQRNPELAYRLENPEEKIFLIFIILLSWPLLILNYFAKLKD